MRLRKIGAVLMTGCLLAGQAAGQSAGPEPVRDRIRALAQGVPFEAVNASPRDDILAHIEGMGRRGAATAAFAVPDLDLDLIARSEAGVDVLMDPRVLDAISRMAPERATQVLRMIEDRRNGVTPLQDIPSLSGRETDGVQEPRSLALRGWSLDRDPSGVPFIQNGSDLTSRIMIVPSMILGDHGRVLSVQDDEAGFRVTLEGGDVLEGVPKAPVADSGSDTEAAAAEAAPLSDVTNGPSADPSGAPTRSVRPRARPEGLSSAQTKADGPVTSESTASESLSGIRPRPRPADLAGIPAPAPQEETKDAS